MTTKRTNDTIVEKLKLSEELRMANQKTSLSRACGIPEGIVHGWMKEENKLCSFVDSIENDIGL